MKNKYEHSPEDAFKTNIKTSDIWVNSLRQEEVKPEVKETIVDLTGCEPSNHICRILEKDGK